MINLDNKTFYALSNSESGEVSNETLLHYSQSDDIISAVYKGGQIINGHLVGKLTNDNNFDFVYHHVNLDGEIKLGKCISTAVMQANGKIKLFEKWQWLCYDFLNRKSELIEI